MVFHTIRRCGRPSEFAEKACGALACALVAVAAVLTGCRNQEAPPETLKAIVVGPVELYGMHLGPQASPQQVTYALMQVFRDAVKTGQRHDRQGFKKSIEVQLQLCAPSRIYSNVDVNATPEAVVSPGRTAVIYKIVKLWAPTAARYVDSFGADAAKAMAAMRVKPLNDLDVRISYDVVDPFDQSKVTFQVYLTREPGSAPEHSGEKFWRVYRLGYAAFGQDEGTPVSVQTRPATSRPTTRPAASPDHAR